MPRFVLTVEMDSNTFDDMSGGRYPLVDVLERVGDRLVDGAPAGELVVGGVTAATWVFEPTTSDDGITALRAQLQGVSLTAG